MQCTLNSHGVNSPTQYRMDLRVCLMVLIVLTAAAPGRAYDAKTVKHLYAITGIRGGVVVHLGVEDGQQIAALRCGERFLVQGLQKDRSKIGRAREYLASQGIHGAATVREFDGRRLPYIDNMVNLVVVSDSFSLSEEEILRVLVPGGKAVFIDPGSKAVEQRLTKPRPEAHIAAGAK